MPRRAQTALTEESLPSLLGLAAILGRPGKGRAIFEFAKSQLIFTEGESADSVYYVQKGRVKISALSDDGREAVLGLAGNGDFVGELALVNGGFRESTTSALTECQLLRISLAEMRRLLCEEQAFSQFFTFAALMKNRQLQKALADQLFDHSEKRLARTLLSLAGMKDLVKMEIIVPRITHQILAEMVGTTRPRVSFFMNRFKQRRLIEYKGKELYVRRTLLEFVRSR